MLATHATTRFLSRPAEAGIYMNKVEESSESSMDPLLPMSPVRAEVVLHARALCSLSSVDGVCLLWVHGTIS